MCGNHALDRVECSAFAGDCDLKAVIEFALARNSLECDLIHVDEVLAQSADVYLRPIRVGVGFEDGDNFLDRAERTWAGIVG
jgi:hypothetical protein